MRLIANQQTKLFQSTINPPQEVDETSFWKNKLMNQFPNANEELLPGLKWGLCYQLYTPAFWKLQYLLNSFSSESNVHRISNNLIEEIILCILGGYGIPSEMGNMAFEKLKKSNAIKPGVSFEEVFDVLKQPFQITESKFVRYRFSHQKATYIHAFLSRSDLDRIPEHDDLRLRNWLITLKGIGPKTASWITRNWLRSERVAILDIHILRAGVITGFFTRNFNITTEYYDLESKYLNFCYFLEVRPSDMDAIIWSYMKKNNKLALNVLSSIT